MEIEIIPGGIHIPTIPARELPIYSIGEVVNVISPMFMFRNNETEVMRIWKDKGFVESIKLEYIPHGWKVRLLPAGTKISFTSER